MKLYRPINALASSALLTLPLQSVLTLLPVKLHPYEESFVGF